MKLQLYIDCTAYSDIFTYDMLDLVAHVLNEFNSNPVRAAENQFDVVWYALCLFSNLVPIVDESDMSALPVQQAMWLNQIINSSLPGSSKESLTCKLAWLNYQLSKYKPSESQLDECQRFLFCYFDNYVSVRRFKNVTNYIDYTVLQLVSQNCLQLADSAWLRTCLRMFRTGCKCRYLYLIVEMYIQEHVQSEDLVVQLFDIFQLYD